MTEEGGTYPNTVNVVPADNKCPLQRAVKMVSLMFCESYIFGCANSALPLHNAQPKPSTLLSS